MQQMQAVADEKKLCYAIVELVGDNGTADSIEKGLFKGIRDAYAHDFLWMKTGSSITRACNLGYYNILSVETYDGDDKTFLFFMSDKDEQQKARDSLKDVFDRFGHLLEEGTSKLIDVDKFTDVPKNFGNSETSKISIRKSVDTHSVYGHGHGQGTLGYTRKEPEPFPFKRETKKPTKTALKKLREKLDLIMRGEYKCSFSKIKGEAALKTSTP